MAAIEGISGAGMAYQGSTATAVVKSETQSKVETTETLAVAESTESRTVAMDTKAMSGDGSGSANQGQNQQAQQSQIKKAVEEINKAKISNSEAIFGIHEETGRVTIKIVDKQSKEVVKEFPPEKTLDMIAKVWEMAGLMVDEKR